MKLRTIYALALVLSACAHAPPGSNYAALETLVRNRIARADSGIVAVSFIDLRNNREIHINADTALHAASTMKVPILIEIFNEVDQHQLALDSAIVVRNLFQSIADTSHYSLDPADDSDSSAYNFVGRKVTVLELARRMIVRSSNLATNNLIDLVTPTRVRAAMTRIGANGMNVQRGVEDGPAFRKGMNNTTTSRGLAYVLASIARCNHNTRASCERMLDILSGQEFNEMIPAGLPEGTRVAHKTGWINGIKHDGAIVFPPHGTPYVLVVLTKGVGTEGAANAIGAEISRLVWDAVVKQ